LQIHKNKKIRYFDLIIAIIIIYISIKIIDNYKIIFSILGKLFSIVSPFLFALIIAYILNPIMKLFEKKFKFKRGISILFTYISIVVAIIVFSVCVLPKVTSNILDMLKSIPQFAMIAQEWFNNILNNEVVKSIINTTGNFSIKPDFIISKASSVMATILNTLLSKTLSFTNSFIRWVFGFIISIYVLFDKEKIMQFAKKIIYISLKKKNGDRFIRFFKNIHNMIGVYIGIKAIDSLIIGIIAFVGLSIIRSPYVFLIALVVGVTNMIPYFGPFVGISVGFLINLFFSPLKAFVVLLFLFLLQQFDGWYLDPKLIGNKVGLSPLLIIFAVTLGGGLYGPIGMILAVPIMAVIKIYIDKFLQEYNGNTGDDTMEKENQIEESHKEGSINK